MSSSDRTKDLLEQMLAQLYEEQAKQTYVHGGSYLMGQDGQLLGKITDNPYDTDSILNQYGPYGSINNPYSTSPPKLIINGGLLGYVTANPHIANVISPEAFLYTLENDIHSLLAGQVIESETQARQLAGESFIEAQDGTFLGKISPNRFDTHSIFNRFGPYGNKFSQTSIFNKFSNYGNQFSQLSPYNKFSRTPPRVFVKGEFVAYLTVITLLQPRIDPVDILDWAEKNVSKFG
jgi:hypothetical protein